ncbi:MAG: hypothetical protein ACLFM9_00330 [Candidatus Aenigmatarchaeota archaeon]
MADDRRVARGWLRTFGEPFRIEALDEFEFGLAMENRTFEKGETVHIDYETDADGLEITAKKELPDGSAEEIDLPHSFEAEQIGTHIVEAEAVKNGHKDVSDSVMFSVIERSPDLDGEGGEVPGEEEEPGIEIPLVILAGVIVLLLFLWRNKIGSEGFFEGPEPIGLRESRVGPELETWIKEQYRRGHSPKRIKEELENAGRDPEAVDEVLS